MVRCDLWSQFHVYVTKLSGDGFGHLIKDSGNDMQHHLTPILHLMRILVSTSFKGYLLTFLLWQGIVLMIIYLDLHYLYCINLGPLLKMLKITYLISWPV